MELLDACFVSELPLWSAFGNLSKFNVVKNMYTYSSCDSAKQRLENMYRVRPNALDSIGNPESCRKNFRFFPHQVAQICALLHDYLEHHTRRSNSLTVQTQVITALHYYRTG